MPFVHDEPTRKTFKKVNYLKLSQGQHRVRILQDPSTALVVYTHFLVTKTGEYSVACLGDEGCPICDNNRRIILENPKEFRNIPGYFGRSKHYLLNVLDRTLVKTCSQCQSEIKKVGNDFPSNCTNTECAAFIINEKAHPANKVKALTIGNDTASRLEAIEKSTTNEQGDLLSLTDFDIVFVVEGVGREKKITPLPSLQYQDKVEIPQDQLEDLQSVTMKLSAEEIMNLLKGISLKDIFNSRRTPQPAPITEATEVKSEVAESVKLGIEETIKQLFPD